MRKRKVIIVIVALALLGAGLTLFLLTRDSGPPMVVQGNFSEKDVSQIKRAVRRQLWRETFPNFSVKTSKALPGMVKRALLTHVEYIQTCGVGLPNRKGALAWWSENAGGTGYVLTNGPAGWSYSGTVHMSPMPRL